MKISLNFGANFKKKTTCHLITAISIVDEGNKGEVNHYQMIKNCFEAREKVMKKFVRTYAEFWFIYKAESCGYNASHFTAPAMIPKRSSVRIQTAFKIQKKQKYPDTRF